MAGWGSDDVAGLGMCGAGGWLKVKRKALASIASVISGSGSLGRRSGGC